MRKSYPGLETPDITHVSDHSEEALALDDSSIDQFHQFNTYAEQSRAAGFDPIPIRFGTKIPSGKGWSHKHYEPGREWRFHGLGHRTRTIGAIDCDSTDLELSQQFGCWCFDNLGIEGIRIGLAPKWAALVRNEYDTKQQSGTFGGHGLELLGTGQQIVLLHRYPGYNHCYEWIGRSPLDYDSTAELPLVDRDKANELIDTFQDIAKARGFEQTTRRSGGRCAGESEAAYEAERKRAWSLYGGREDRIVQQLRDLGKVKEDKGNGKYEITCPWTGEHTGGKDSGSVYWVPIGVIPGRFTCQHKTCKGNRRNYNALCRWLQNQN